MPTKQPSITAAAYNLAIIARWQDPKEADTHIGWVRAAYGEAKYARLVALKDKYDPDNLFRRN